MPFSLSSLLSFRHGTATGIANRAGSAICHWHIISHHITAHHSPAQAGSSGSPSPCSLRSRCQLRFRGCLHLLRRFRMHRKEACTLRQTE
ncbi:uncharacterized protein BO96DRAFT_99048 [Aspergillus niger CBS 101883]|uniref:uncharacterized protein n=1 Tax=Aspergillus lacticoffeatus (strain CBS 101883) TaxID=1450533 RepID=UPI000D80371C|nr:uncharacterized protein BO96DRAFT_99048 [Aspergillus niger CBS 101883]PYH61523.1 hypothetical protein BO96DRAFT_99048 [Aspergillus niger CBS 101883]